MRKPDKNFKMPNYYKNMLGGIKNPQSRSLWKQSFIQAAMAVEDYRKSKVREKAE